MIDMLMDCSVFLPLQAGHGNYYQLSGACFGQSIRGGRPDESRSPVIGS